MTALYLTAAFVFLGGLLLAWLLDAFLEDW